MGGVREILSPEGLKKKPRTEFWTTPNTAKDPGKHSYLSTDYFGTRLIIFDNNMNTIGNHFLYQVRGQISYIYDYVSVMNT